MADNPSLTMAICDCLMRDGIHRPDDRLVTYVQFEQFEAVVAMLMWLKNKGCWCSVGVGDPNSKGLHSLQCATITEYFEFYKLKFAEVEKNRVSHTH